LAELWSNFDNREFPKANYIKSKTLGSENFGFDIILVLFSKFGNVKISLFELGSDVQILV